MNKWNKYLFLLCIGCTTGLHCMKRKRDNTSLKDMNNGKFARQSKEGKRRNKIAYNNARNDRVKSEIMNYISPIFGKDLALTSLVRAVTNGLFITTNRERKQKEQELVKKEEFVIDTPTLTTGIFRLKNTFLKYYPQFKTEDFKQNGLKTICGILQQNLLIDDIEDIKKDPSLRKCKRRETDKDIRAVMLQCKIFLVKRCLCSENETNFCRMVKKLFLYAMKLAEENYYNLYDQKTREYKTLWKNQVDSNQNPLNKRRAGLVFTENFLINHTNYSKKSEQKQYPAEEVSQINHIMEWLKQEEEKVIAKFEETAINVLGGLEQEKL